MRKAKNLYNLKRITESLSEVKKMLVQDPTNKDGLKFEKELD